MLQNTFATETTAMSVIIVLLVASVSVASLFLLAFLWSVKSGQFEDEKASATRILFDDKPAETHNIN